MKAVLCKSFGPPERLVLEETESPIAGKGQVLIQVKSCGVNFPDTLIIEGKYQFKPEFPFSPGGEVAGVVASIGAGVSHVKVGQDVMALTGWGGFAEEVVVSAGFVMPMPPNIPYETASAMVMTYGTSYHGLVDRAQIQPGETLLVLGASGGVGLAAVELGNLLGARVIAAASTAGKLALCREYGASETINYSEEDLKERIKVLTDGKGVDVVYDPVGGDYTETALRRMAWKGRYLVVGFAAGDIPAIPLNLPLLKGCEIVGVFWGDFAKREAAKNMANFQQIFQWYYQGKLKPHIHAAYPLKDAAKALNEMLDRKVKGKVVLVP